MRLIIVGPGVVCVIKSHLVSPARSRKHIFIVCTVTNMTKPRSTSGLRYHLCIYLSQSSQSVAGNDRPIGSQTPIKNAQGYVTALRGIGASAVRARSIHSTPLNQPSSEQVSHIFPPLEVSGMIATCSPHAPRMG